MKVTIETTRRIVGDKEVYEVAPHPDLPDTMLQLRYFDSFYSDPVVISMDCQSADAIASILRQAVADLRG
jgi:hypothetical protein